MWSQKTEAKHHIYSDNLCDFCIFACFVALFIFGFLSLATPHSNDYIVLMLLLLLLLLLCVVLCLYWLVFFLYTHCTVEARCASLMFCIISIKYFSCIFAIFFSITYHVVSQHLFVTWNVKNVLNWFPCCLSPQVYVSCIQSISRHLLIKRFV